MSRALILVGGFGTRLRPLTLSVPKPLVPFANEPMMLQQVEALIKVGVKEVILAVNYRSEVFTAVLQQWESKYRIKFTISQEHTPMGTGGPLALARKVLESDDDEPFFVLNSDVVAAFQHLGVFERFLRFHRGHKHEGSILVTRVTDPTRYGVVVYNETDGAISRFVEKPQDWVGDKINAGIYLFNKAVLNRIENKPTSIEQETFPEMANAGELYAQELEGFWMDVGQPRDYLIGMCLYLASEARFRSDRVKADSYKHKPTFRGNVLVDSTATFGKSCVIGPNVVIGRNVEVGDGVVIKRSTLLDDVKVGAGARIVHSIIGWKCILEAGVLLSRVVLGEGVTVGRSAAMVEVRVPAAHVETNDFPTIKADSVTSPTDQEVATTLRDALTLAFNPNGKLSSTAFDSINNAVGGYVNADDYPSLVIQRLKNLS